ncbi:MAG: ATP-binding protein [Halieaceae bacterium]|jgi:two-component system sensor histidine kinase PhoQ|nr:ATP-binding protein [Halieaceae bacterium]
MAISRSPISIQLRLLAATLLILPLFLGLTAWILDRAFASYQLDAQAERMRLMQLLLAKATEWDGTTWTVEALDEARLELLDSGLYAFLLSPQADILWASPSAGQIGEIENPLAAVSEAAQGVLQDTGAAPSLQTCRLDGAYFCYAARIAWGSSGPESIFLVIESQAGVIAARAAYRDNLLLLCLVAAALLLLTQWLVIRWGLFPLRRIAAAVDELQQGRHDRLGGDYPPELLPLTRNINLLLDSETRRRERVRSTMDRLAHVLKTPLMVIRNSAESDHAYRELVQEQVDRMLGVVESGLTRARLDGRSPDILGQAVVVQPVLQRIVDAYRRLPRPAGEPTLEIDTSGLAADATFLGEEPDLQDLFGSILENSIRHCHQRIAVACRAEQVDGEDWLLLTVGDDGDGIPPGYETEILRRGARADTANLGHGLGLSIVVEIVSAYGGSLSTDHSTLGGALFVVRLPGARTA